MAVHRHEDWEIKAAQSEALFRTVNEQIRELNEAFGEVTGQWMITCECFDPRCIAMLPIDPDEYAELRRRPRRFVVLPGHLDESIERVVAEREGHAIVEKHGRAGRVVDEILS